MADAYYLTEEDLVKIRQIAEQVLGTRKNSPSRYRLGDEESQSPDVYVARTPAGGIPALNENTTVGTGSLTDDTPGSAICDIYRLTAVGSIFELHPVGLTRRVYNIGTRAVAAGRWILVLRDKFGSWYTNPREPFDTTAFSGARIYWSATVQDADYPGASSFVQMTFDTAEFDIGGYTAFGSLPNRDELHITEAGYYLVGASLDLYYGSGATGVADGDAKLVLYKTNSPASRLVEQDIKRGRAGFALETFTTTSGLLHLGAGDAVGLFFEYFHSGTAEYLAVFRDKRFWITRLG